MLAQIETLSREKTPRDVHTQPSLLAGSRLTLVSSTALRGGRRSTSVPPPLAPSSPPTIGARPPRLTESERDIASVRRFAPIEASSCTPTICERPRCGLSDDRRGTRSLGPGPSAAAAGDAAAAAAAAAASSTRPLSSAPSPYSESRTESSRRPSPSSSPSSSSSSSPLSAAARSASRSSRRSSSSPTPSIAHHSEWETRPSPSASSCAKMLSRRETSIRTPRKASPPYSSSAVSTPSPLSSHRRKKSDGVRRERRSPTSRWLRAACSCASATSFCVVKTRAIGAVRQSRRWRRRHARTASNHFCRSAGVLGCSVRSATATSAGE